MENLIQTLWLLPAELGEMDIIYSITPRWDGRNEYDIFHYSYLRWEKWIWYLYLLPDEVDKFIQTLWLLPAEVGEMDMIYSISANWDGRDEYDIFNPS